MIKFAFEELGIRDSELKVIIASIDEADGVTPTLGSYTKLSS